MIPVQLHKRDFRFVLINPKEKSPFEKEWQLNNNYSFDSPRLNEWINKGGNYGVIGGFGNLLILDFDDKEFEEKIVKLLPETFTTKSGRGGLHKYYLCDDPQSFKVVNAGKKTLIDIQGKGKQVVGAGSIHPSGNKYEVVEDKPISNITISQLKIILGDYLKEKDQFKPRKKEDSICEEVKKRISLSSLMSWYNYDLGRNPTMCMLGHDSVGKKCFSWSDNTGLWYCHHCNKGGDIFTLKQEQENINFSVAKTKLVEQSGIIIKDNELKDLSFEEIKNNVITNLELKRTADATEIITEHIKNNYHIYTTRDDEKSEVWIYNEGIYVPQGRTYIKEICRLILGKLLNTDLVTKISLKIETDTYIDQDKFFKNESILFVPVQNGILNIKKRELIPFSHKMVFFNKLPLTYDKTKYPDLIVSFLKDILQSEEDLIVIQELFGYLLYRNYKFEKAFMLLGEGRNGKGKTVELMKRFLGIDNCSNISLSSIEKDNFAMGELFNKMANLSADLSKTSLVETGNFKSLTGHDLISAPRKFLTRVNFVNYAKMIFCANDLPITKDITPAFFMRWIMIDFPFKFIPINEYNSMENVPVHIKIQDTEKIDKISTPEQMSGLLNWALEGLDRLLKNNCFSTSTSSEQVRIKWLRKSSSLNAFIMDMVIYKPDSIIPKSEFRLVYASYCREHQLVSATDKEIKETLSTELGVYGEYSTIDNNRVWIWKGINFKDTVKGVKGVRGFSVSKEGAVSVSKLSQNAHTPFTPFTLSSQNNLVSTKDLYSFNKINEKDILFHIKHLGKGEIPIEQLIDDLGITMDIINKLKRSGDLFEQRAGWVKIL